MERPLVVERVSINDVICLDKIRYNTSNHWVDKKPPSDYKYVSEQTNTSKWIDGVKEYHKIEIDLKSSLARWMKDAFKIGVHTGAFPKGFEDELDLFVQHNSYEDIFTGSKYFVRTETVSLKGGMHGVGPYMNMRSIIESIVTCHFGHTPMNQDDDSIVLYLIPWVELSPDSEYRVFVYQEKITAISQQHLYHVYQDTMETHFARHVSIILSYFESFLISHLAHVSSYCIDIAVLEGRPFFIEINPFGKEYSSGSSLYGWIQDEHILLGHNDERLENPKTMAEEDGCESSRTARLMQTPIYFRYTIMAP